MPRIKAKLAPEKQLMFKTKACQRLIKEAAYYEVEVQENEAKLQKMRDEKKDRYDIKKFEEVLGESYMMIPDSRSRMAKTVDDLKAFVEEHGDDLDAESEFMVAARKILDEQLEGTEKEGDGVEETKVDDLEEGEAF